MKILMALTYYRPHYSGLTIYTERLARAFAQHGHQVTVLTSRFDPQCPKLSLENGVTVRRLDVMMHLSKGVIMPGMPYWAFKLAREADAVILHVPQLDAAPISVLARLMRKPVILTYHCDLRLPKGVVHWIANRVSNLANHLPAFLSDVIVTNTQDYADHTAFLKPYLPKIKPVVPPAVLTQIEPQDVEDFKARYGILPGQPVIGMAARLAVEKGAEYLAQAMPKILARFPDARVLYVGQYQNVMGEEEYARRIHQIIQPLGDAWRFLGVLPDREFAAFFKACTLTVLPSINSTESFGIVQVESMMSGTPVVATDLPGVRQPVLQTGMGRIVPPASPEKLAEAIMDVIAHPEKYHGDDQAVIQKFSPDTVAARYEEIIREMIAKKSGV